jgi:hypothetical protein
MGNENERKLGVLQSFKILGRKGREIAQQCQVVSRSQDHKG